MEKDLSDYLYLDWAATAPLSSGALKAMEPFLRTGQGSLAFNMNANSLHRPGRQAFEAMEKARKTIAQGIGARRPSEVIFTSGATEADNLAIFGLVQGEMARRTQAGAAPETPRIITSAIEHSAVLGPVKRLEKQGFEVIYLAPDPQGFISCEALEGALNPQTILVSIQMANSELGSIQPVEALAALAHDAGALFHTDATQALGKIPLAMEGSSVDAASFSAHKIGGPKGVGALYLRAHTPFTPQLLGGGQEDGRRSTTQNVCGIVGFAGALTQVLENLEQESARQRSLRDGLYEWLAAMDGIRPTVMPQPGSRDFLPHIVHGLCDDLESETVILRLDARGIGVSGGSACSSHSLKPSRVLRAIGVDDDAAYGALRVSFGPGITQEDLAHFVQALTDCLA